MAEDHYCDLMMEIENVKPGYSRLRLVPSSNSLFRLKSFLNSFVPVGGGYYLSSELFRRNIVEYFHTEFPDTFSHGPCATRTDAAKLENDNVICFHCKVWPRTASEWITRRRLHNWPPRDLIDDIVNNGCFLVPLGHAQSSDTGMEWRISFSIAEKKLTHSFNHTQFLCYGLLKMYLKHVIESEKDLKELVTSYFLKTSLFYCIEEESLVWEKQNLLGCFWQCFKRLITWVRDGYCPNFFIKENNMFEGKIFGEKHRKLLSHISKLHSQGYDTLMNIMCLSDIHADMRALSRGEARCRPLELDPKEKEVLCDGDITVYAQTFTRIEQYFERKHDVRTVLESSDDMFVKDYAAILEMKHHMNLTPILYHKIRNRTAANKERYRNLMLLRKHIVFSCTKADICTGWLQYATLCYLTGNLTEVLRVIQFVFARFQHFTMYKALGICNYIENEYIAHICGRNLTILKKNTLAVATTYCCLSNCGFYPREIRTVIETHSQNEIVYIPPVVYSNVLLFLTYNNLGYKHKGRLVLKELENAANDKLFAIDIERPVCFALLEKCVALQTSFDRS